MSVRRLVERTYFTSPFGLSNVHVCQGDPESAEIVSRSTVQEALATHRSSRREHPNALGRFDPSKDVGEIKQRSKVQSRKCRLKPR